MVPPSSSTLMQVVDAYDGVCVGMNSSGNRLQHVLRCAFAPFGWQRHDRPSTSPSTASPGDECYDEVTRSRSLDVYVLLAQKIIGTVQITESRLRMMHIRLSFVGMSFSPIYSVEDVWLCKASHSLLKTLKKWIQMALIRQRKFPIQNASNVSGWMSLFPVMSLGVLRASLLAIFLPITSNLCLKYWFSHRTIRRWSHLNLSTANH